MLLITSFVYTFDLRGRKRSKDLKQARRALDEVFGVAFVARDNTLAAAEPINDRHNRRHSPRRRPQNVSKRWRGRGLDGMCSALASEGPTTAACGSAEGGERQRKGRTRGGRSGLGQRERTGSTGRRRREGGRRLQEEKVASERR